HAGRRCGCDLVPHHPRALVDRLAGVAVGVLPLSLDQPEGADPSGGAETEELASVDDHGPHLPVVSVHTDTDPTPAHRRHLGGRDRSQTGGAGAVGAAAAAPIASLTLSQSATNAGSARSSSAL